MQIPGRTPPPSNYILQLISSYCTLLLGYSILVLCSQLYFFVQLLYYSGVGEGKYCHYGLFNIMFITGQYKYISCILDKQGDWSVFVFCILSTIAFFSFLSFFFFPSLASLAYALVFWCSLFLLYLVSLFSVTCYVYLLWYVLYELCFFCLIVFLLLFIVSRVVLY